MKRAPALAVLILASAFSASAQTATTHQATISWTASTTAGAGYIVYRATVSGGPWTAIAGSASAPLSATTYTDTAVTSGTTYYYEVDAVLSGDLSGPSTVASGTIPTNPQVPTGIAVTVQ